MKNMSNIQLSQELTTCLFTPKDMYLVSHDSKGRPYTQIPKSELRKFSGIYKNLYLLNGLSLTEKNKFPIMKPYKEKIDTRFVSFCNRKQISNRYEYGIHFFLNDYRFFNLLHNNITGITRELSEFSLVFAPDFSLYSDAPEIFIKLAIFYRQLYGAHWQRCGIKTIPVAGIPNAESLDYALEGLPTDSVIGYCGMGHHVNQYSYDLWLGGLYEIEKRLHPRQLVIYGKEENLPGIHTPYIFIPDHITARLRNNK